MTNSQPGDTSGSVPSNDSGSIAAQPFSVGAALREARLRLGLSVAEATNRIKFAPRQIEALEADDFAYLPEMAFVRGFVRSYARLLQIDPAPLLAALPGAAAQPLSPIADTLAEVPFPNVYSARKPNIIWLAAALVVAVVLVLFVWLHGGEPNTATGTHVETLVLPATLPVSAVSEADAMQAPQVAASAVQQAAKPVATNSASEQTVALRLVFDEESWAEVTDREGKILLSQINPRGSEQSLNGKPPLAVAIGHASGVRLYYKSQAVNLTPHTKDKVARLKLE